MQLKTIFKICQDDPRERDEPLSDMARTYFWRALSSAFCCHKFSISTFFSLLSWTVAQINEDK